MVRDAIRDAARTDRMGRDEAFAKYLNDTLGMKIMPTLSRERSLDNNVSKDILLLLFSVISAVELPLKINPCRRLTNKNLCST